MDNRAEPWINLWTASCPQAYPQPCWKPVTHKLHSFGGGLPDLMQQWSLPDLMQQKVCIYIGKWTPASLFVSARGVKSYIITENILRNTGTWNDPVRIRGGKNRESQDGR